MFDFLQAEAPMIPNLAGIKFTNEDFMDYLSCLQFMDGRFDMLWGRDEKMLSALVPGARGAVGSTYNYAAPLYLRLIAWQDLPPLPPTANEEVQHGLTDPVTGELADFLLVAGGSNFRDGLPWKGGTKQYHDEILLMKESPDGSFNWEICGKLPV